ncbi:hypothetical protein RF11_08580 [Thelohanellus kitauei]|uniref:F-box domain-containing protein n=1 Tax=Thelohanellus kitauei TaxID=669202 RepID=A0A0C2MHT9_THEKT|nr:hypothetical protein RF11_08580 [Thelohanellus kitauei]
MNAKKFIEEISRVSFKDDEHFKQKLSHFMDFHAKHLARDELIKISDYLNRCIASNIFDRLITLHANDLFVRILSFCDTLTITNLMMANKDLWEYVSNCDIWKNRILKSFDH